MFSVIIAQEDFNLVDLNPNSISYGDTIGPGDYIDDICIIFLNPIDSSHNLISELFTCPKNL